MEIGQVGGMLLMLSAVVAVEKVISSKYAAVPIQYHNVGVKTVREMTPD